MAFQGLAFAILIGIAIGGIVYQIVTNTTGAKIHRPMDYGQRAIQGSRPPVRNRRRRYSDTETACRICLFALYPEIVVLRCGHACHIECIDGSSIKCSLCQQNKTQQNNTHCCVCSKDLTPAVSYLKCKHKFHEDCIKKWNNNCPLRCS